MTKVTEALEKRQLWKDERRKLDQLIWMSRNVDQTLPIHERIMQYSNITYTIDETEKTAEKLDGEVNAIIDTLTDSEKREYHNKVYTRQLE